VCAIEKAGPVKRIGILLLIGATAVGAWTTATTQAQDEAPAPKLETDVQKASYGLGHQLAKVFGTLDLDAMRRGYEDGVAGKPALVSGGDSQAAQQRLGKLQAEKARASTTKKSAEFFVTNKAKEGVVETKSGLQYKVLTAAEGAKPKATDKVTVHYTGTLLDGTVFDSSVKRGTPATFPLNGVIKGWTEGVQLMAVGSKFRFFIPSGLAYGPRGRPPTIGPDAPLLFDIELLAIEGAGN
jgi:FKBP-type peptidyl-prolyl cis-trans isomerase